MNELFAVQYSWLIPLLPLVGAAICGLFGAKVLKQHSHWPIWLGVGISAAISITLLVGMVGIWSRISANEAGAGAAAVMPSPLPSPGVPGEGERGVARMGTKGDTSVAPTRVPGEGVKASTNPLGVNVKWFDWINVGGFKAEAGAWIDPLTAIMLGVVTVVGFFITIFSAGYMRGEDGYFRFFAYLGLFIFMMTCLVMGNNLLMLYLGWEGVGLSSYLLIGYYYERPAAREAAKKAFLVNRVGDFGFGLGIMACYLVFGTITYFSGTSAHNGLLELATNTQHLAPWKQHLVFWIPFLLMIGAFGKSAQFPLYVWLPDAMEGPTPVSALIHAATMVTAGVYMIVRCGTLFVNNSAAMWTIAAVGAFTALLAAIIALRQFDLKKILAYSTISQLGYMFVGVGCLAPVAGVFHLITHAFFKALLFLAAGVVMHAMSGELDFRKFSGLKRVLPWTRWTMLIGCLALAGFPMFSGFLSKDEVISATWEQNRFLGVVMLFTAFLTAYYTFRLYFRTFEGPEILPEAPAPAHGHGHESHEEAVASESAVLTETAPTSGVDVGQTHHKPGAEDHAHGHHSHEPWLMILPLVVLAVGAIFAGYINWPETFAEHGLAGFLGQSPSLIYSYDMVNQYGNPAAPEPFGQMTVAVAQDASVQHATNAFHRNMMIASGIIALVGIFLAYLMHLKYREEPEKLAERYPRIFQVMERKFWVDEVYQNGIVEPLRGLGRVCVAIDNYVIDGIIWILSFVPQASGFVLKLSTQRGYLQGYAVTMVLGVTIILLVVFL